MRRFIKIFLLTVLFLIFPLSVNAEERVVNIHLFYGDGCPHCASEKEFLNEYLKDKTNVKLYTYEVWYNSKNQKYMADVQKQMGVTQSGVPYTIIGKKSLVGYSDGTTDKKIKDYIEYYLNEENDYRDYAGEITGVSKKLDTIKEADDDQEVEKEDKDEEVEVPILGKISARDVSLPLLAVVLGFVDGFNPCAMWILIFLITMLFNMKDRKKMWILGLTFILTSGNDEHKFFSNKELISYKPYKNLNIKTDEIYNIKEIINKDKNSIYFTIGSFYVYKTIIDLFLKK